MKINSKKIKLILGLVLMTALSLNSFAQEFKPNGKMFAQFFGDLYYKAASDTTAGAITDSVQEIVSLPMLKRIIQHLLYVEFI